MRDALDTLALYGICAVLGVAFYYQFARGELPCPLCALQRVGFVVAGVALVLNLRSGYSPAHYGLALLSAVAAALSLLHAGIRGVRRAGRLRRGDADGRPDRRSHARGTRRAAAQLACWIFMLLAAANAAAFVAECGLGPCPDNPTGYLWWPES